MQDIRCTHIDFYSDKILYIENQCLIIDKYNNLQTLLEKLSFVDITFYNKQLYYNKIHILLLCVKTCVILQKTII